MLHKFALGVAIATSVAQAEVVNLVQYNTMEIPITPFSNMASGYQATNPGFRAILKSSSGEFVAGGDLTIDAVIKGYSDDASKGSAYGRLVLVMDVTDAHPGVGDGTMSGRHTGTLSICMARDVESPVNRTECQSLSGNIHPERPFQWLDKKVDFVVESGGIKITKYYGNTGEGGTSQQLSLAAFHPAYGFAAPGKAFKDYQSPLVLDLDGNGKLDLVNVWDEKTAIRFDLNGSGQKVRTGWVKGQDGLLFWDSGSGCAKNGTEFFGEYTHSKKGELTYANGFEALASVTGGKISPKLKVWRDRNQDGICQKAEVVAAKRVMRSISLQYETIANPGLTEDNEIRLTGHFVGLDGKQHLVGDVWFKQRRKEVAKH